jgi:hypothetical protein
VDGSFGVDIDQVIERHVLDSTALCQLTEKVVAAAMLWAVKQTTAR